MALDSSTTDAVESENFAHIDFPKLRDVRKKLPPPPRTSLRVQWKEVSPGHAPPRAPVGSIGEEGLLFYFYLVCLIYKFVDS